MNEPTVEAFEAQRHRLFGVAYRMLGSVTEAEDAVQETWIRWADADHDVIVKPEAWLTTVVGRISVDRLRSAQKRREHYVGPWLPEPLVRADDDPADHVALADTLSLAFLELLERLDPVERAAFLLREVFSEDYADVAAAIDRTETATRQIVHRAKERLGPDRPVRFDPGPDEERRLVDSFLAAAASGDLDALHAVLADDVVAWSDGGPHRYAARRPVLGRHRVGRFVVGVARRAVERSETLDLHPTRVNGDPGVVAVVDGTPALVMAFQLGPVGIQGVRIVLNPEKLTHLNGRGRPD